MGGHCFFVEFFAKWNSNRNTEIPSDSRETSAVCQESCARCGEEGREGDVAMGV